ncbi:MAG: MmcQ/YjbR family DNA-binding protein [Dehalococcoidales bacterium]|nr:MmcQ/YjbR family DNA-binding protein [Dehalococcoidales bacterium]
MNLSTDSTKEYCLSKPGATVACPSSPEQTAFVAAGKVFALFSTKNNKPAVLLKCDPFVAEELRNQYPAIQPGQHLNEPDWNTLILDGTIPDSEILWMIDHSYELVTKPQSQ